MALASISGSPASLERPLLAPWWRVVEDGGRVLFEHAGRVVELRGRAVSTLLPALLPLLDGSHTFGEIVAEVGVAAEPSVRNALELLDRHGLLVAGPAASANAAASHVASVCPGATPASADGALRASRVGVSGSAHAATQIVQLLESAGVETRIQEPGTEAAGRESRESLLVSAPAPREVESLLATNEQRLRDRIPWLVVLPGDGRFTAVGPLHVPGQTACHVCYLARRAAASGYEPDFPLVEKSTVRAPMPAAVSALAAGLAALICLRWLAAQDPTLPGVLYAFETQGVPALTRHRVLRVPRCPACGTAPPPPNPWFKELHARAARRSAYAGR